MANEDKFHLGLKALIRDADGRILLLKVNTAQLRNHSGPAYFDIPGGRIKRGDSIQETLAREVMEETGLHLESEGRFIAGVVSNIRIPVGHDEFGLILFVYECHIVASQIPTLSEEHTEYAWADPLLAAELLGVKYPKAFTDEIAKL